MLKNIYVPWGAGIGTLGFDFTTRYVDYTILDGTLRKFESTHNAMGGITSRSWYKLVNFHWVLVRREDQFGIWRNGRRREPLLTRPDDIAARAWELREQFKPYKMIDWYGKRKEVISYPSPENNSVNIMIRDFNDPTTLEAVVLESYM